MPYSFLRPPALLAAFLLVLPALTAPARAVPITVVGSNSEYGTVDSVTGAYTGVGSLRDSVTGAPIAVSGIAFGVDNNLYGVTGVDGGTDPASRYLWRFNPRTGVSTDRHDLSVALVTVARRPSDGALFGYNNDSGASTLYDFDLNTYSPTPLGATNLFTTGALTFDDASNLYLADTGSGSIFRVNPQTGATSLLATTGSTDLYGMVFADGLLQAFDGTTFARYTIDTGTGAVTTLSPYSLGNANTSGIVGAARPVVVAVVPEAGSGAFVLLVVGGGVGLVGRRRRFGRFGGRFDGR